MRNYTIDDIPMEFEQTRQLVQERFQRYGMCRIVQMSRFDNLLKVILSNSDGSLIEVISSFEGAMYEGIDDVFLNLHDIEAIKKAIRTDEHNADSKLKFS